MDNRRGPALGLTLATRHGFLKSRTAAMDIDHRLTELEIKASFTEELVEQLNLVIVRQQQQIDRLEFELGKWRQQQPEAGVAPYRSQQDEFSTHELPPHY